MICTIYDLTVLSIIMLQIVWMLHIMGCRVINLVRKCKGKWVCFYYKLVVCQIAIILLIFLWKPIIYGCLVYTLEIDIFQMIKGGSIYKMVGMLKLASC